MNIQPMHDRVFVKRLEDETISQGGIFIPDVAQKRNAICEVIAVGPGRMRKDGTLQRPEVEVGCKVLLAKYDGQPLDVGGQRFIIVREEEILAIMA